jgi:hypothetical protein
LSDESIRISQHMPTCNIVLNDKYWHSILIPRIYEYTQLTNWEINDRSWWSFVVFNHCDGFHSFQFIMLYHFINPVAQPSSWNCHGVTPWWMIRWLNCQWTTLCLFWFCIDSHVGVSGTFVTIFYLFYPNLARSCEYARWRDNGYTTITIMNIQEMYAGKYTVIVERYKRSHHSEKLDAIRKHC